MTHSSADRRRLTRGLAAALLLLLVVGGGFKALASWGRLDVFTSWANLWRPDAALLLGVFTIVGWVAWAVVTLTVIAEAINAATSGRVHLALPGFGWLRAAVAVLVISVAALAAGARLAAPSEVVTPVEAPAEVADVESPSAQSAAALRAYVVRPGDDLWSLAERFAAGGGNWRTIAAANSTVVLDPSVDLVPGTLLMVPVAPTVTPAGVAPQLATAAASGASTRQVSGPTVTVQRGDTLWGLAKVHLGDGGKWPALYQANQDVIQDPQLIHPGQRLVLPSSQRSEVPATHAPLIPPLAGTVTEVSRPPITPPPTDAGGAGTVTPVDETDQDTGTVTVETDSETGDAAPVTVEQQRAHDNAQVSAVVGSIGAGLAAALVAGVALQRLFAMRTRPLGRRLPLISRSAEQVETALGRRAALLSSSTATPPEAAGDLEPSTERGILQFDDLDLSAPLAPPGSDSFVAMASVVLGVDDEDNEVTLDLMGAGLVVVQGASDQSQGVMASMLGQLMAIDADVRPDVVVADDNLRWLARLLDCPTASPKDVWALLRRRMVHDAGAPIGDPLVVFAEGGEVESPDMIKGLENVAVVTPATPAAGLTGDILIEVSDTDRARLSVPPQVGSGERLFSAQLVVPPARRALAQIVEALTSGDYPEAPWWSPATVDTSAAWLPETPRLLLLGPVMLQGARGEPPARSEAAALECCGWLLDHPDETPAAMTESMLIAESTRRSNLSRLRAWLGVRDDGVAYLPEARAGRVSLHQDVTSDWAQFASLVAGGVPHTSSHQLEQALRLVRGAPLGDAAPGQWQWAQSWRYEMISAVRDVGVVLCGQALSHHDLELARWAVKQGLMAAPDDEQLMAAWLRTEHAAGNRSEVERIAMSVTRAARAVDADLSPQMVVLLQEVIEGRPRMQLAS